MQHLPERGLTHALKALVLVMVVILLNGCGGIVADPDKSAIGTANGGVDLDYKIPRQIVFKVQPTKVRAKALFNPAIIVQALAENGTPMTDATGNVTIELLTSPGSATLGGTRIISLSNGEAMFSDLTVSKNGKGYALRASLLTAKNTTLTVDSNTFNVSTSVTPGDVSKISWTSIGPQAAIGATQPLVSGRASSSVVSADGRTIWLGTAGGGVWKTVDGGASWVQLTDNQSFSAVGSLAVDPSDSNVLYVGTGEAVSSGDAHYGDGVYKTTDGGNSFTRLAGSDIFNRTAISKVVVSRQDSKRIFVGVYGPVKNGKGAFAYGVYRSADGGQTFTNVTTTAFGGPGAVTDLIAVPAADPSAPDILFAGVDGTRTPAGGVWTSADNGNTWTRVSMIPSAEQMGRVEMAASTSEPRIVYAFVGANNGDDFVGLYGSNDRGATWVKIALDGYSQAVTIVDSQGVAHDAFNGQSDYSMSIAADPNSTSVYLGLVQIIRVDGIDFTSRSGNVVYLGGDYPASDATHAHVDFHGLSLAANPDNPGGAPSLYAATDGGLFRLDAPLKAVKTTAWNSRNGNLASLQFNSVATQGSSTATLGGTQDNGTLYSTGQPRWGAMPRGGDGGNCFVDQQDDLVFAFSYQSSVKDIVEVFSGNGINMLEGSPGVDLTDFVSSPTRAVNFYTPFTLHRDDPKRTVALGTYRVWETTTNTLNQRAWTSSPALTDSNDYITSLDYGVDQGTLYAVSLRGKVFVRRAAGGDFVDVSAKVPLKSDHVYFLSVAVDCSDDTGDTAYVAVARFTGGGGHVFQTSNGGDSWSDISSDLPDIPINGLAVDPNGTVFAAADNNIYARALDSASWITVKTGLPTVQCLNFDVSPKQNRIVVATHGRGVFSSPLTGSGSKTSSPAKSSSFLSNFKLHTLLDQLLIQPEPQPSRR